jgi:alkylated DNA repair protein (DNA oxidative demethylase)
VAWLQTHLRLAPWFQPTMPRWGNRLSVLMTNAGPLGWVSDVGGYRYQATHPDTGAPWPPIPPELLALWDELGGFPQPPECCLVNLYRQGARMGLHQDKDEQTFAAPVVSVSLGDAAIFRIGGTRRSDPTETITLRSGDVVVLAGAARLAFHGIDRVLSGTSELVPGGGRVNLTLRRVTRG